MEKSKPANLADSPKQAPSLKKGLGAVLSGASAETSPNQQFCGDIDMRIARDGTWFYHGSPIGRKQLVKLFSTVLRRDSAGDFWLETPVEKCRIQVEDAPYIAVEMWAEGTGVNQQLEFRTNVDDKLIAGPENPIRVEVDPGSGEPSPYVLVREGLEALIARAVYYDLVELAVEEERDGETLFGVWSGGAFFPLGDPGDDSGEDIG
tara:strand:- start:840 stop:1457 length:618 start_codon:yes stop_codon:yes gene_type:complete